MPNEHACRINDPGKYDRFARKNCERKVGSKCVDVIYGIAGGKAEVQALRYPKDVWDAAAAKAHCAGEKGSFEAASGGEAMAQQVRIKGTNGEYGPMQEMTLADVVAWLKSNSDAEGNVKDGIVLYGDVLLKAAEAKEDQEEELFEWTMSDYTLDRDMERIDPEGWDLKNYRKNPVVLWGHNPNIPAIGVAEDASVDKETGRLRGKIKFSAKEVDPFAWMIKEKIREGILRTGSVGFQPKKVEIVDHSDDDKDAKGKRDETRLIHRKQELFEFSIVNIPANPSASVRREMELSSAMTTTAAVTATSLFSEIGNYVSGNGNAVDGAWSVRGLGYKQQPGYVDVEHEAIRKELALMTETLAEFKRIMLFPLPTVTVTTTSTADEPEEDKAEEKAAAGVLADMALRIDDIEEKVNGLIERVGVAEPEPEETASFYDELFKGSRRAPNPLDQLLNPSKPNDKR